MARARILGSIAGIVVACCTICPVVAQTTTPLFSEDFDQVVEPALPAGWLVTAAAWETSSSVSSDGSGGQNVFNRGSQAGHLISPVLDLSGATAATLTYFARRTSTYDPANLQVTASTDGGATFPTTVLAAGTALPATDGSYQEVSVALPGALVGAAEVVLRFEALGNSSSSANVRIDDVGVEGVLPVPVAPRTLTFAAPEGTTQMLSFTVTNLSGDVLTLAAPQVTGAAFSIVPTDGVTLDDGAAQAYEVTFTPPEAGSFEGSVVLTHGLGTAEVTLTGTTAGGQMGFAEETGTALETTGLVEVPLALSFSNMDPLQGLQFRVSWDDPVAVLTGIGRGAAVSDEAAWTLSYEAGDQEVRVLLMGNAAEGLASGTYDPLLRLQLSTGPVAPAEAVPVHLTLSDLVGALAVPTGDDAGLAIVTGVHTLNVERRRAYVALSATALDVGTVAVGQTGTAELEVTNTAGTRDLVITEVASDNPAYTVEPASATIAPEETAAFTITFTPSATAFGLQEGTLTLTHDGEDGPAAEVAVTGFGTGGRGDAGEDGLVDVLDLVFGVDFVLGRAAPTPLQQAALDLFPFPDGDGALDVRDLTVLAQAIVRDAWPDDTALPAVEAGPSKQGGYMADGVAVLLEERADGLALNLEHAVPVRALQLVLGTADVVDTPVSLLAGAHAAGATLLTYWDAKTQEVRLLLYRVDGGVMAPGRYPLAWLPGEAVAASMTTRYATAVGEDRHRLPVAVLTMTGTEVEEAPGLPEAFELGIPYPNPFRAALGALHIPVALPEARTVAVAVYDVLGRRVAALPTAAPPAGRRALTWDGRGTEGGRVAPGLYILRVQYDGVVQSRPLVIVP